MAQTAEAQKQAARDARKRWRLNNPEKRKEERRRWKQAHPEQVKAAKRRWREKHPDKVALAARRYSLKKLGMTIEEYDEELRMQEGVCASCFRAPKTKRLGVDKAKGGTGLVRGLLCAHCRRLLSIARFDAKLLHNVALYARTWQDTEKPKKGQKPKPDGALIACAIPGGRR